eukprot:tig00021534_g22253.t1
MKEVIQLLAMTFHKTYESNPGSFEFTFSKEVLSGGRARQHGQRLRPRHDARGGTERYAGYMNTCYIQGRLPAGIEEATETCDWPTVYGMLHPFMPNVVKHLADNGYVTADEFGYAAAVLYAFNLVGPWNFCDKPYCGIIKGQSGTGKSMVTQIMTECLPPGRNVRGDDVRTKATRKVLVIVCNSFRSSRTACSSSSPASS